MYILFHSFDVSSPRRLLADMLVNISMYIPLGFSAFLVFRTPVLRFLTPVALGALLSGCIEMTQIFTPGRNCSTNDLINNTLGSVVGVIAAFLFERIVGPLRPGLMNGRRPDPSVMVLLLCQSAAMLFPFFPVVSLPTWSRKISAFIHGSPLDPIPLISAAAWWTAVAFMIRASGIPRARVWIFFSILLIPAQLAIVTRQPLLADVSGAVLGILFFFLVAQVPASVPIAAWAFMGVLVIRGVVPFHWSSEAQAFIWIPFGGFLNADWQVGLQFFLQKVFYYGAAVWMFRRAAIAWIPAMGIVCAVLAAIEIIQIHLPGRTPEITDPLLALLVGLVLRALERPPAEVGYHANS